jgi:hypothetical protein
LTMHHPADAPFPHIVGQLAPLLKTVIQYVGRRVPGSVGRRPLARTHRAYVKPDRLYSTVYMTEGVAGARLSQDGQGK